jgi:dienelactone hydrolase
LSDWNSTSEGRGLPDGGEAPGESESAEPEWRPRASGETARVLSNLLRLPRASGDEEITMLDRRIESGLVIEDFRFDSEPGETVSGMLAKPEGDDRRLPVILCLHEINQGRKTVMGESYVYDDSLNWLRGWGRELARRGFITAGITQRTFGKRPGELDEQAKVELLYGRTLMGGFVWEALQTLDLLARRDDADPNRLGIVGYGLGGTVAFYTAVLDDRVQALATACGGIGSMDLLARWSDADYHDLSYFIPGILDHFDHADLISSLAPRAYLLLTRDSDEGMPLEGIRRAEWEGGARFRELAAETRFKVSVRPGARDFDADEFDEAANWMMHWLSEDAVRSVSARSHPASMED